MRHVLPCLYLHVVMQVDAPAFTTCTVYTTPQPTDLAGHMHKHRLGWQKVAEHTSTWSRSVHIMVPGPRHSAEC